MNRSLTIWILTAFLVSGATSWAQQAASEQHELDVASLPNLQGSVRVVEGNMDSFMPPGNGDALLLRWGQVQKDKQIRFKAPAADGDDSVNYIPLPDSLSVTSADYTPGGSLSGLRLECRDDSTAVTIDVAVDTEQKRADLLIIVKQDAIRGVAWMTTTFTGEFPSRKKLR